MVLTCSSASFPLESLYKIGSVIILPTASANNTVEEVPLMAIALRFFLMAMG